MNTFLELQKYGNEQIEKRPDLKENINDLIQLAISETQEGGSKQNEIDSCEIAIDQLIESD